MVLEVGTRFGPYEIVAPLGAGGMGQVYKAKDIRLRRPVVLKLLPAELVRNPEAKERFVQEARAASALDHPNVCTIYEIDETPDALLYLAMAFYEGATLKERIERGPLGIEEIVEITRQVASGLREAHGAGIVHRDIKPANIAFGKGGVAKILDFGVAKLTDQTRMTQAGMLLGTIAYMSPEQARAEDVDARSDIWSLGAMLYEMLVGRPPFEGDNLLAVLNGILQGDPPPLEQARPELPVPLVRVVRRALERDVNQRYQSCADLLADLAELRGRAPAAVLDIGIVPPPVLPSIAVLPFADMSPHKDQEYLCEGIAEEILNALAKLEGLRVAARTSAFRFSGHAEDVRRIGESLSVGSVLEGSVRIAGSRMRVTAQLINVADGYHLWSDRFDGTMDDIFAFQDEIARSIADHLQVTLSAGKSHPLVAAPTSNLEAYRAYLKGRYLLERRDERQAMECFGEALALDPTFAQAHSAVALAYTLLGIYSVLPAKQVMPQARAAAERALACDDRLPEAHAALGLVSMAYDWDFVSARRELERAVELNPRHAEVRSWHALYLLYVDGRFDAAVSEARHALKLDPLSLHLTGFLGEVLSSTGRHTEAVALLQAAIEKEPTSFLFHHFLGLAYEGLEQYREALDALDTAVALSGRWVWPVFLSAWVHARSGNVETATSLYDELVRRSQDEYVQPFIFGLLSAVLGRMDEAFEALEQAYTERDAVLFILKHWRMCHILHGDPRYPALLARIGLE